MNNKKSIIIVAAIITIAFIALLIYFVKRTPPDLSKLIVDSSTVTSPASSSVATSTIKNSDFSLPVSDALTRVTKKPFGINISPDNSPVIPENFTGYHTGVDFETTASEQNSEVPVFAICSGPLQLKKVATGYGGVAIQSCRIKEESVTIIYGHLRLESVNISLNTMINQGHMIGILGKGYSQETAGERKHLHLGIHKGTTVSLLGYVPTKDGLDQWIDFLTLVK